MVAFVRFDLDPTSWGAGGRFSYIAIGLIWTALFAEAQRDDAEQE
jgi:hypothetical protein